MGTHIVSLRNLFFAERRQHAAGLVHTKWAVARSAFVEWKGQRLGKGGGASSMIFRCLNPKS